MGSQSRVHNYLWNQFGAKNNSKALTRGNRWHKHQRGGATVGGGRGDEDHHDLAQAERNTEIASPLNSAPWQNDPPFPDSSPPPSNRSVLPGADSSHRDTV